MNRTAVQFVLIALGSSLAGATPYWVEYSPATGNYPEVVGWSRLTFAGGAQRWFDNGSLVVDSRASLDIVDSYSMLRPGQLDPGPGELFVMSWRMQTEDVQSWDSGVGLYSDERRSLALYFAQGAVEVPGHGFVVTFDPNVFHDFEFRSSDMLTYDLYIDDGLAYSGDFAVPLLTASKVAWGDPIQGGAGLTRWERFSFGVVPEPTSALVGLTLVAVARRTGSAYGHRKREPQCRAS